MSAWILDYDDRSDGGPLLVGPFLSREAAEEYAASLRGPGWSASYCVTPLAVGDPDTRRARHVPALRTEGEDRMNETDHAGIVREATDLCWKATPFTEDATGAITAYLLPAGVVHRLLGALQGAGYPAAFRALGGEQ